MCGGRQAAPATIVMPNTQAYDREFDLQRSAIEQQMQGQTQLMQAQLQQSMKSKEDLLQQLKDYKVEEAQSAERLEEQAQRMSVLIGPPPPEESAKAPLVGPERNAAETGGTKRKGKSQLRIGRTTATTSGKGAGLNIT